MYLACSCIGSDLPEAFSSRAFPNLLHNACACRRLRLKLHSHSRMRRRSIFKDTQVLLGRTPTMGVTTLLDRQSPGVLRI